MHILLQKLLSKRGINKPEELSAKPIVPGLESEQQEFDKWQRILSVNETSVEDVLKFCQNQIRSIENQWKDFGNSAEKNQKLIVAHTIYSTLVQAIKAPQSEKENLEKFLSTLLTST